MEKTDSLQVDTNLQVTKKIDDTNVGRHTVCQDLTHTTELSMYTFYVHYLLRA